MYKFVMRKVKITIEIFCLSATVLIFAFLGCGNNKYYSSPEEVIQANIDYMNAENLEGTMSTFHPDSPTFDITEKLVKKIFDIYDLNYKIEKLKVTAEDAEEATVEFTQLTTRLNGPAFRNNRVTGKHLIKKNGDSWKIYSTQILNSEYLN
jgi:hypothetical protein